MLEVTFTESAGGSLQLAQAFGKGELQGSVSVIFMSGDGSQPAPAELEKAQREAEERAQKEWDAAIPMGGNREDVFCFPLGLSMGNIREPFSEERQAFLQSMICIQSPEFDDTAKTQLEAAKASLGTFLERAGRGEAVRVWYSRQPDELCGIHWLMTLLDDSIDIRAVELPLHEERPGNIIHHYNSWGDIAPGEWHRFTALEKPISPLMRRMMAQKWRQLAQENAPLRAGLNGNLMSYGMELYDHFIEKELDAAGEVFREAVIIGNVLGKYQLGIGDWFVHARIEEQIRQGRLIPVTEPGIGNPVYHRIISKVKPPE